MEIIDVFNFFIDFKHDVLLTNLNIYFKNMILEKKILEKNPDKIREIIQKNINENINEILPDKMKSGLSIDIEEFKNYKKKKSSYLEIADLNKMIGFEIFPSLITQFCLCENTDIEEKILKILSRLYNQKLEFAQNASKLQILIDDMNIKIFKASKIIFREMSKHIDQSEVFFI